ncbi:MAG: lipoprotein [Rhizobiales bacterium]|nr:lipoprotein [Hyphomicrobiales bacterium]
MSRYRPFFRLALIGAVAASLTLAACGRKGPLESPPGYQVDSQPQANNPPNPGMMSPIGATPIGGQAKEDFVGVDSSGRAVAPKGQKKSIPLDVLLN